MAAPMPISMNEFFERAKTKKATETAETEARTATNFHENYVTPFNKTNSIASKFEDSAPSLELPSANQPRKVATMAEMAAVEAGAPNLAVGGPVVALPQPIARAPMLYVPRPLSAPANSLALYGTLPNDEAYEAAKASGKLTLQAAAAYDAAKARYAATPLGLTGAGMLIDSARRKSDLTASKAEQTSVANALERDTKAQEAAAVTEREQIASYEKMRSEFDTSQATRVAEMDAMKADIAATKIDPSQYFSKNNAFGNVLSLLAVALGGYAEGYSGGRLKNNALAMLQSSIDNDIAAQKSNLDNKKSALGAAQSIYGLARQQFGDDQQAAEFTRARQNEVLKTQALRFANEGRTAAIRANAAKLAEHLNLESQDADNRVQLMHANAEQQRIAAAHRGGGGGGGATLEEKAFAKERAAEREDLAMRKLRAETAKSERDSTGESESRKDKEIVNFEGVDYLVPKNAARDLQASAGAAEASRGQVDALKELSRHKDYHNVVDSPQYNTGEMIRGNLVAGLAKNLAGGFNPSATIEDRASGMVKKAPYALGQDAWEASIESIPVTAAENVRLQLKAAGATRRDGGDNKKTYILHENK